MNYRTAANMLRFGTALGCLMMCDLAAAVDAPRTPAKPAPAAAAPALSEGDSMIRQAYQITQTGKTDEDYTRVIELSEQAIKAGVSGPNAAYAQKLMGWAHNRRGEALAKVEKDDDAMKEFSTAVALDPQNWRAVHNRGVSFAQQGKYQQALEDFNTALQLNKNYPNTWFNRGELLYDQGKFSAAISDYTQAIRLNPRDAAAYNSRGHAYYRLGNYTVALRDYNEAVRIQPADPGLLTNRGDALADQGNYPAAAEDFREAVRLDPKMGRAYQSAAWLMATCPDPRFRNPELALEAANKSIEIDGDKDYRYLDTLAAAQANAGQMKEAVATQIKVVDLAKDAGGGMYRRRLELYQAGRPYRQPLPQPTTPAMPPPPRRG